jgi:hypothetical protein
MSGKALAVGLLVAIGLLTAAYFRGTWPFRGRAIITCAATSEMATCLEYKYGWERSDAMIAALRWQRTRGE